jgi:hypothetical protein
MTKSSLKSKGKIILSKIEIKKLKFQFHFFLNIKSSFGFFMGIFNNQIHRIWEVYKSTKLCIENW